MTSLSREVPIDPAHAALLFIDVQNYSAHPDARPGLDDAEREALRGYFRRALAETALPNMQRLQAACRSAGIEVLYTVIENLTRDGRDRSLDYKISGIDVPKGSWGAQVLVPIKPSNDEIVIGKTSSSVFISTNIDYVLRNLGIRSLIVAGLLTDQCVDSAVRDACDLGYLVTLVTDACATHSAERHDSSLRNNRGYCRQRTTAEMLAEINSLRRRSTVS
jgi:ureidoacrylate peracid hydrolase